MILDFYRHRIESLEEALLNANLLEIKLTGYIHDLCDKDCPEEYKAVVVNEVFHENNR